MMKQLNRYIFYWFHYQEVKFASVDVRLKQVEKGTIQKLPAWKDRVIIR